MSLLFQLPGLFNLKHLHSKIIQHLEKFRTKKILTDFILKFSGYEHFVIFVLDLLFILSFFKFYFYSENRVL